MKKIISFAFCTTLFFSTSFAQNERSPFRKGYIRLGVNNIGERINTDLSVKENILRGKYGSDMGYVFETGTIFYFNKPKSGKKIGYGLDWTIISFTYNSLNKWKNYATATGNTGEPFEEIPPLTVSASSKLGPVISFNPVEKLIIDTRVQVVAGASAFLFFYNHNPTGYYFEMLGRNESINEEDEGQVLKMAVFSIKPNFGITARWKAIGLALDYAPGKINMNYGEEYNDNADEVYGKAKIKTNTLQLKLSFTF